LTLGSAANDNTAGSVKPFGISAITLDSSNNTFTLVVNNPDGSTSGSTSFTVAEGTYNNMTDLVAAMNTALDGSICATSEPWEVVFSAQEDTGVDPIAWGVNIASPSGYEVVFSGTLYTEDDALDSGAAIATGATKTISALSQPAPGDAAYNSSVEAGAYVGGVDLLVDETDADDADRLSITATVTDNATGEIIDLSFSLDSGSDSVAVSEYLDSVVAGINAASTAGGYQFSTAVTANDDGTFALSMTPAGPYTLSVSGMTVTESFGGPITASGEASNIDGLAFESMDDVVSQMNAAFEDAGLDLVASFNRGGDTWTFAVTGGPSDATSVMALSGDALADVGFTGTLDAIGGGTASTETVRYVSQIDISTRDTALLAMTVVDAALETIAANRAGLGAVANRLEATISNLMTISENTAASMSRVMDADFAAESTRLARAQILQETSVAMLAQANAAAQTVLKLLQ
jgi:flagellin-like hook-associated protein FlgL